MEKMAWRCLCVISDKCPHLVGSQAETEALAKWFATPPKSMNVTIPKTLKLKKEFADLAKVATQACGKFHLERRSYLTGQVTNLVLLLKDVPRLVAPKFPECIAALSLARAEVLLLLARPKSPCHQLTCPQLQP